MIKQRESSFGEHRLVYKYNWNLERLIKETGKYAEGVKNPVDAVLRAGAAGVHVFTGITESVIGDIIRLFQRKEGRVELKEYSGLAPRLKLDGSEAVSSIKNTVTKNIASILTLPVIATKTIGDAFADGIDGATGMHRSPDYAIAT